LDDVDAIHAYLANKQKLLPERLELTFLQKIEYWFNYWMAKLGEIFPELLNATRPYIM
jgi:quinohemoprotein ethanol dehydrogenase